LYWLLLSCQGARLADFDQAWRLGGVSCLVVEWLKRKLCSLRTLALATSAFLCLFHGVIPSNHAVVCGKGNHLHTPCPVDSQHANTLTPIPRSELAKLASPVIRETLPLTHNRAPTTVAAHTRNLRAQTAQRSARPRISTLGRRNHDLLK
jgi:hypothetical protein